MITYTILDIGDLLPHAEKKINRISNIYFRPPRPAIKNLGISTADDTEQDLLYVVFKTAAQTLKPIFYRLIKKCISINVACFENQSELCSIKMTIYADPSSLFSYIDDHLKRSCHPFFSCLTKWCRTVTKSTIITASKNTCLMCTPRAWGVFLLQDRYALGSIPVASYVVDSHVCRRPTLDCQGWINS